MGNTNSGDFIEPIKGVRVSRREFTKFLTGLGLLAGPGSVILSACGSSNSKSSASTTAAAPTTIITGSQTTTAPTTSVALVTRQGEPIIGLVSTLAIEFYNEWNKGAQTAAKALGLDWQLQIDDFDVQKAEAIIDSAVSSKVRLFATSSLSTANEPLIAKKIVAGGSYLINNYNIPDFYTPFDSGPKHIAWLVPDEILAAEQLATIVIQAAGGKGNFAHITGLATTPVDWRRTLGVDNALKKFPDAKLVARSNADWDRVKSQQLMATMLVQTGKKIDGVFGQNDDSALGALAALKEAGLKIPLFGMDGVKEVRDLITKGDITTSSIVFPTWIGGYNVVQVFDALNGFTRTDPERMMYWTSPPLTIDGVAPAKKIGDFKEKVDLFDWELMSRVLHPDDWDPQNELSPMDPEQIWATRKKPSGWVSPEAASISNGDFEKVRQMYADHYKQKII